MIFYWSLWWFSLNDSYTLQQVLPTSLRLKVASVKLNMCGFSISVSFRSLSAWLKVWSTVACKLSFYQITEQSLSLKTSSRLPLFSGIFLHLWLKWTRALSSPGSTELDRELADAHKQKRLKLPATFLLPLCSFSVALARYWYPFKSPSS